MNGRKRQQQSSSTSYPLDHPVTPPPQRLSRPLPPWPVSPAEASSSQQTTNTISPTTPASWGQRSSPMCPGAPSKKLNRRSRVFDDDDNDEVPSSIFRSNLRPRRLDFGEPSDSDTTSNRYHILQLGISSSPPESPLANNYNNNYNHSSGSRNPPSPLVFEYDNNDTRYRNVSNPRAPSRVEGIPSRRGFGKPTDTRR